MDVAERIRGKIQKELKYYRIQNIRLLQEIEELEDIVSHNRKRLEGIDSDREESEHMVRFLRSEAKNGKS